MLHKFDEVVSRQDTDSAKWDYYHLLHRDADRNCLPLWVADMDFPCSDAIVDALHKRVDRRIFGYSNASGEFFRSICGWYQHRFGWYVNSESIVISPGIVSALGFLIQILTEPGDGVLIQAPVYYPFKSMIVNNKREVVSTTLINDGAGYYTIDFEEFEKCVADPNTRLFILCSPHNPVGRVWTVEELRKMTELCVQHGVKIISDEIHSDLVRKGIRHVPLPMACPEHKTEMMICTSPSKTFNVAGFRTAFIVIEAKDVRQKWGDVVRKQVGISMMSPMAIVATEAAYYESEEWLNSLNEYLDANLQFMKEYLAEHAPNIKFRIPEATYLTWLDIRDYGLESVALYNELVTAGKVMLESGTLFGDGGNGYIRLNAALPRVVLEEALRRFASVLNRMRRGSVAPDFQYSNSDGEKKSAHNVFRSNKKTLLCFLRYAGCTLCQYDVHELSGLADELSLRGIVPVVVMQSTEENVKRLGALPFEVICDADQELYKLYSVMPAFEGSDMMDIEAVKRIALASHFGFTHGVPEGHERQLPAVMVIDENGLVEYANYPNGIDIGPSLEEVLRLFPNEGGVLNDA